MISESFISGQTYKLIKTAVEKDPNLKKLADLVCPSYDINDNWGYQHMLWTYRFLMETKNSDGINLFHAVKDNDKNVFQVVPFENPEIDNLINFAVFHNKPQTKLQAIIRLADAISCGMQHGESIAEKAYQSPEGSNRKTKYRDVPLFSLFNEILSDCSLPNMNFNTFPLTPLSCIDSSCMPVVNEKKLFEKHPPSLLSNQYAAQWNLFCNEIKTLPSDSAKGFSESLLFLLKRHTWCIPASTLDVAHVSLFEHMKTTAAFTQCLCSLRYCRI